MSSPQNIEKLLEAFRSRAARVAGDLYFEGPVAIELVRSAEALDLVVIGVEAHVLTSDALLSPTSMIADYSKDLGGSWSGVRNLLNAAAEKFIGEAQKNCLFSLVLLSRDEFESHC